MGKGKKRLAQMRNNPKGDWTIDDVRVVCHAFHLVLEPPSGGSHWTVAHPIEKRFLTIPAHGRIKPFYIKQFVELIDDCAGGFDDSET
ncbi:hypothetical protein [Rhodomicrobium vannielii]|nr:hypothetical protein [Rhodomicrobium vannielii]